MVAKCLHDSKAFISTFSGNNVTWPFAVRLDQNLAFLRRKFGSLFFTTWLQFIEVFGQLFIDLWSHQSNLIRLRSGVTSAANILWYTKESWTIQFLQGDDYCRSTWLLIISPLYPRLYGSNEGLLCIPHMFSFF